MKKHVRYITPKDIVERIAHLARMAMAGVDQTPRELNLDWGPPVILYRTFDDGTTTEEWMSQWIGQLTLAAIPHEEPTVKRARLFRVPIPRGLLM